MNRNVIEIDECFRLVADESAARCIECDSGMTERTVVVCFFGTTAIEISSFSHFVQWAVRSRSNSHGQGVLDLCWED